MSGGKRHQRPQDGNDFNPFRIELFKNTACYFHVNALQSLVLFESHANIFLTKEAFASLFLFYKQFANSLI